MSKYLFAALLLLVFNRPAEAQAGTLAAMCQSHGAALGNAGNVRDTDAGDGICIGTISGYREVLDLVPVLTPDRKLQIHIAPDATTGQLIRVFVKFVKAHPEKENMSGFVVFFIALNEADLLTLEPVQPAQK